jgi:hypothetical protein
VPGAEIALSAVAGPARAAVDVPVAPDRVIEATVDQLAEAELCLLGLYSDEAARLVALLPDTGAW